MHDSRQRGIDGEPMLKYKDMPEGDNSHTTNNQHTEPETRDGMKYPSMDTRATQASRENPQAESRRRYDPRDLRYMKNILKKFGSEEMIAELGSTPLGDSPEMLGAILERRGNIDEILEVYDGVDAFQDQALKF